MSHAYAGCNCLSYSTVPSLNTCCTKLVGVFCHLQQFIDAAVENAEWVSGHVVEKVGMTVKHGIVQGQLSYLTIHTGFQITMRDLVR